jgi:aspartate/glutamate racemase
MSDNKRARTGGEASEDEQKAMPAMPTMGMLTGLSYVSGVDYYRSINEKASKLAKQGRFMPRNPPMVIVSLDCDEYVYS